LSWNQTFRKSSMACAVLTRYETSTCAPDTVSICKSTRISTAKVAPVLEEGPKRGRQRSDDPPVYIANEDAASLQYRRSSSGIDFGVNSIWNDKPCDYVGWLLVGGRAATT
jgi:hypothetical protein